MTATCTDDGGSAVLTATTVSEPPGIVLAWDVQRTAYAIEGAWPRHAGRRAGA